MVEGRRDWREVERAWRLDRDERFAVVAVLVVSNEAVLAALDLLCCLCDRERRVLWEDWRLCALLPLSAESAERGALTSVISAGVRLTKDETEKC